MVRKYIDGLANDCYKIEEGARQVGSTSRRGQKKDRKLENQSKLVGHEPTTRGEVGKTMHVKTFEIIIKAKKQRRLLAAIALMCVFSIGRRRSG
jgi:hypothetical protein